MKIHSLCGRLRMRICDFESRERMWKTGLAQAMRLSPPKGSVPEIIETLLLVPITNDLCRQSNPLQTDAYGQLRIIIQGQAFCCHIPAQSGNRKGIHKISELQQCTVFSLERTAGYR